MSAVAALPDLDLALLEDLLCLDVGEQLAVALLVGLLDCSYAAELLGEDVEALCVSGLGEAVIHVGPLVVLALSGSLQVLRGRADSAELLEPELGMLLLVLCSLEEQGCNLLYIILFLNDVEHDLVGVFL